MIKHKDPLLKALKEGKSFTWTTPDDGDFASMRQVIHHGQTLTMSPVRDISEIQVGDIVLLKWHQSTMMHLVSDIQAGQFLIINSMGKINGWVSGEDILGRITHMSEPEQRPEIPVMLEQLEVEYRRMIDREHPGEKTAHRLLSIVDDLRWYAERLGSERCERMPRSNKWSFAQNLWHLKKQTGLAGQAADPIIYLIDDGKVCVGSASEILTLFEEEQ